jgi:hypothetical protein
LPFHERYGHAVENGLYPRSRVSTRFHPAAPLIAVYGFAVAGKLGTALSSPMRRRSACRLAGYTAGLDGLVPQHIGPGVQRLLDRLADTPVAVFDASWTRLEQNDLWTALTGDVRRRSGRPANIMAGLQRRLWARASHVPGRL